MKVVYKHGIKLPNKSIESKRMKIIQIASIVSILLLFTLVLYFSGCNNSEPVTEPEGDETVMVIIPDVFADNGVIHVVDTVILGPWPRAE